MDLHADLNDRLVEFVRCGDRFVLLGGYAVGVHVKPRATKDLELPVSGESPGFSPLRPLSACVSHPATAAGVMEQSAS